MKTWKLRCGCTVEDDDGTLILVSLCPDDAIRAIEADESCGHEEKVEGGK